MSIPKIAYSRHLPAVLMCLAFVLFRGQDVSLPFFWDASWVYAPAISVMAENTPSLLADSLPANLGRGHPLFFHFLLSAWAKIFGFNPTAVHTGCLLISLLTLVSVYVIGISLRDRWTGLIALVICASQEIFLAQSTMALPEMLLTFLVLLTMWSYWKARNLAYVISATCLLLTKESGIACILAIVLFDILRRYSQQALYLERSTVKTIGILILPLGIASLHYIYQQFVFGWYFFPEHTPVSGLDRYLVVSRIMEIIGIITVDDGRLWLSTVAMALVLFQLRKKGVRVMSVAISLSLIYIIMYGPLRPLAGLDGGFILSLLFLAGLTYLITRMIRDPSAAVRFSGMLLSYLLVFAIFSSFTIMGYRYFLNLIPVFALLVAVAFGTLDLRNWQFTVIAVLIMANAIAAIRRPAELRDTDLNFRDVIAVQKEMVRFFNGLETKDVLVLGSLMQKVTTDPLVGYLDDSTSNFSVRLPRDTAQVSVSEFDYVVNTNVADFIDVPAMAPGVFELCEHFTIGEAQLEIWCNTSQKQ